MSAPALFALVVLSATPGSRLVPATAGGSPDWLIGPLRPLGVGAGPLFYAGLWLALLAYAVVVARAREIPRRVAVAAVDGLHLLFLLAPPCSHVASWLLLRTWRGPTRSPWPAGPRSPCCSARPGSSRGSSRGCLRWRRSGGAAGSWPPPSRSPRRCS